MCNCRCTPCASSYNNMLTLWCLTANSSQKQISKQYVQEYAQIHVLFGHKWLIYNTDWLWKFVRITTMQTNEQLLYMVPATSKPLSFWNKVAYFLQLFAAVHCSRWDWKAPELVCVHLKTTKHSCNEMNVTKQTDWVKVFRPTRHKIRQFFGDVPWANLLGWYEKTKPNTTKAHNHQSNKMYYNIKQTQNN